jgi:hypothetical protein
VLLVFIPYFTVRTGVVRSNYHKLEQPTKINSFDQKDYTVDNTAAFDQHHHLNRPLQKPRMDCNFIARKAQVLSISSDQHL